MTIGDVNNIFPIEHNRVVAIPIHKWLGTLHLLGTLNKGLNILLKKSN